MAARWVRTVILLFTVVGLIAVGSGEAKEKRPKPAPPPVSDLPNYVSYLAWQLRGKHMDESGEITGQIQKAVLDHLQQWLAAAPERATDIEVRRELERVFYNLRYPTSAKPSCFDAPWKDSTIIGAGYTLHWTNYNRANVLAIFVKSAGKVRLAAVTHFLPMVDLLYDFPPSQGSDDFRFFAYGTRPGKSQPRLSAVLYSFDGQDMKSLWETRDIYDGKLDVGENQVTIRYLKEDEYIREQFRGRKPPRHQANYRITSTGLELESDREVPF